MLFVHDNTPESLRRKTKRWGALGLLPLVSLALLAGCGGGGGGGNGNPGPGTTTTGTNTGTQTPLIVTKTTATGLTASLSESSGTVSVGGTVVYTLTLTNNTASPIPIRATTDPPTSPAAGLTVRNASGATTFQPLPGPPQIINSSLGAGKSISTTITANGFTAAGVYGATAVFGDDPTADATLPVLIVTAQ